MLTPVTNNSASLHSTEHPETKRLSTKESLKVAAIATGSLGTVAYSLYSEGLFGATKTASIISAALLTYASKKEQLENLSN